MEASFFMGIPPIVVRFFLQLHFTVKVPAMPFSCRPSIHHWKVPVRIGTNSSEMVPASSNSM